METASLNASGEKPCCYRWGGIAALLLAIGYVSIVVLFARMGVPPTTGEGWFRYLPGKTTVWWVILWLSVITDLLYLPVAWALWFALNKAGKKSDAGGDSLLASIRCSRSGSDLDALRFTAGALPEILQCHR